MKHIVVADGKSMTVCVHCVVMVYDLQPPISCMPNPARSECLACTVFRCRTVCGLCRLLWLVDVVCSGCVMVPVSAV